MVFFNNLTGDAQMTNGNNYFHISRDLNVDLAQELDK